MKNILLFWLFLLKVFSAQAFASLPFDFDDFWFFEENSGAVSLSLAGSSVASAQPAEGFLSNPSLIKRLGGYWIEAEKSFYNSSYQVNVQDAKTSNMGGGFSLKRLNSLYGTVQAADSSVVGLNFLTTPQGGLGVNLKRWYIDGDWNFNLDLGVSIEALPGLRFGAVLYNLLESKFLWRKGKIMNVGLAYQLGSLELMASFKKVLASPDFEAQRPLIVEPYFLALQELNQKSSETFHAGLKYQLGPWFLSAGLLKAQDGFLSGNGFGFLNNGVSMQYSFATWLKNPKLERAPDWQNKMLHSLSLLLVF